MAQRFSTAAVIAAGAATILSRPAAAAAVTGDYVEARSASVYAGACHYNGEMTTAGREAVLAWKVTAGSVDGVRLDGLSAVAVVSGDANLAVAATKRRSVLYVDQKATPAQRDALVGLLTRRAGAALGTVAAVKTVPVRFAASDKTVTVTAGGAANLSAARYPCRHCVMPAQIWYAPLAAAVANPAVAQGIATGFKDATLGVSWSQEASDNVFVGTFAL